MLPYTILFLLTTLLLATARASSPSTPLQHPYPQTAIPVAPRHPVAPGGGGGGGGGGRPAPRPAPRPNPRPDGVDEAESDTSGSGSGSTSTSVSASQISPSSTQTVESLTTSPTTGSALSTTREAAAPVEMGAAGRLRNGGWGVAVAGLIGLVL